MSSFVLLSVNGYLMCVHIAKLTGTEFMYVMIESTMQFDVMGVLPGLLPVFLVV